MLKTTKITVVTILSIILIITIPFASSCILDNQNPPRTEQGLDVIAEVWDIIVNNYVDKDELDTSKLSQAAIEGMLKTLDDPYTAYMDTEAYQLSLSNLEGKFEGIGAAVGIKDDQIMIIAPFINSPADIAGIKAGDIDIGFTDNIPDVHIKKLFRQFSICKLINQIKVFWTGFYFRFAFM